MTRIRVTEYLRVGSASAPSNTTAGDLTVVRLHVGTDGAFSSGIGLQAVATRGMFSGALSDVALSISNTITSADGSKALLAADGTLDGAGADPAGMNMAPSLTPSGSITNAYGLRNRPAFNAGMGVTITNAYGQHVVQITGTGAGAITNLYAQFLSMFYQTIKPTNAFGLNVEDVGSASITKAVALRLVKPTNATNNYYMELDTADATDPTGGGGAATGRIPVLIGGVLRYLAYY